jgi:uncharacterized protein (UPF0332 family)
MLNKETIYLSDYRFEKAQNLLAEAEILLNGDMYSGCVNRSYYSIFSSIRAIIAFALPQMCEMYQN